MSASPSFQRLLSRVRNKDANQAAEMLVERFASRLALLATRKMSQRVQQRVAPEDVVQSVFATFFRQQGDGRYDLRDWESLWGLLAQIAVWRISRHTDRHFAARRSIDNEKPLDESLSAFDREPDPQDILLAEELRLQLLNGLTEKYRPIAEQILDGATHEEIAQAQHTSISTVERVHRRARERLSEMMAAEEAA